MSDIIINGQVQDTEGNTVIQIGASVKEINQIRTDTLEYRDAAEVSATNAATSETNAGTSESNMANSEANVTALEASTVINANAAATSESNAFSSAENSALSASQSSTAKVAAEIAQSTAEGARDTAVTSATNASTSESNSATSESNASTSETNASTSETNAFNSATSASNSASSAAQSAIDAQAVVGNEIGMIGDVDTTGKQDGDALVYNSTSGNWRASSIAVPIPTFTIAITMNENETVTGTITNYNSEYGYTITADTGVISNVSGNTFSYTAPSVTDAGVSAPYTDVVRITCTFGFFTSPEATESITYIYVPVVADTAYQVVDFTGQASLNDGFDLI